MTAGIKTGIALREIFITQGPPISGVSAPTAAAEHKAAKQRADTAAGRGRTEHLRQ